MKLNLGCGQNKRAGYINIDKYPTFSPDLLWDLEQTPYPFDAESITEIAAIHVLEHLGQQPDVFLGIIKELHRLLVPDGTIEIKAPHYRSGGYWDDPTHVRPISPEIMSLFSKEKCRMFAELGWPNTPLADYLDVDLKVEAVSLALIAPWAQRLESGEISRAELDQAMRTQWNVVDEITMIVRKVAAPSPLAATPPQLDFNVQPNMSTGGNASLPSSTATGL